MKRGWVVLLLAMLVAGCGGSSKRGRAAPVIRGPLLARTLGAIQDSPSDLTFEFGDIAAQRALAGVPPSYAAGHPADHWLRVLGVGASYFEEDPRGTRDGLDILTGDVAMSIGEPPHEGALIAGPLLNGARVRAALLKLGARPGTVTGHSGLVWGAEGSPHIDAANAFGIGPALGEFDRSVITAHQVITGRFAAQVATLEGGGPRPALQDPVLDATITCLGDVIAADGLDQGGTELAVGVRRPANATSAGQEVLCVVPSPAVTGAIGRVPCSRLEPTAKPLPSGGAPSQLVASDSVLMGETGGRKWLSCVLADPPARPVGWLLSLFDHPADVDYVLGSP
jgi:hypothetical protein